MKVLKNMINDRNISIEQLSCDIAIEQILLEIEALESAYKLIEFREYS